MPTTHTADTTIARYRTEVGANQRLVVLDGGPNEPASAALIPEASMLVGDREEGARRAAELRARPLLAEGDVIHVRGFGPEVYVARRVLNNRDWWHLVPVGMLRNGRRYYIDFQGERSWLIRDAADHGAPLSYRRLDEVQVPRIQSLADAETAVRRLHEEDPKPPTWEDYRAAIGSPVKATA